MKLIKSIVRFFADITGVSNDIYYDTIKSVGGCMYQNAYWWNGGVMHKEPRWPIWNAFFKYAESLKEGNISPDMMRIRSEVYKLGDKPYQTEIQK